MSFFRNFSTSAVSLFAATILLTGCGMGTINTPVQTHVPGSGMSGVVFGGQNPINGATISIVTAGVDVTGSTSSYGTAGVTLAQTTTDSHGNFSFSSVPYTCPQSDTPVYLIAAGGDPGMGQDNANAVLAATLGSCSAGQSAHVYIDEVTTVAAAYALSGYFTNTMGTQTGTPDTYDTFGGPGSLSGTTIVYPQGLVLGNSYTSQLIANNVTGAAVVSSGELTAEPLKIYSLANILGACVNSGGSANDPGGSCDQLFSLTTPTGGTTPSDTLQAAVQIARNPNLNVASLFALPGTHVAFESDLASAPADWSVAVSHTSANLGVGVDDNTLSTIDIDQNNKVWLASNVGISRSSGDSQIGTMGRFHPDGAPINYSGAAYFDQTSATFNGPYNPGIAFIHPEQVVIDNSGVAWFNDTHSDTLIGINTSSPATSTTVSLANTQSYAMTIGMATSPATRTLTPVIKVGVYDSTSGSEGNYFATYDLSSQIYSEDALPSGGLPARPVSLTSNAATSGNYFALFSNGSNGLNYETYDDGLTESEVSESTVSPTLTSKATATALPGQVSFNGTDLFGLSGYPGSGNADGYCFAGNSTTAGCYSFSGSAVADSPAGLAVDGKGTAWVANEASGTLTYTPLASGSYLSSGSIPTLALNHNSSNGGTAPAPEGIAIDGEGNIWVSNAGCVGGGDGDGTTVCTPGPLVLTQYIGAAAPTITPVSAQVTSGNRAAKLPSY
jgi:hypothetical protein